MARTAPTYDGTTPTLVRVSFRFMDASGDMRTVSHELAPADATVIKIEALASTLSAITNAVLYAITKTDVYQAVADPSDAVNAVKDSVYDNVVVQLKNTTNQSVRGFIPAPAGSLFLAETDNIDPTNVPLSDYLADLVDVYAAGGYTIVGARYTERREINEQIRF